MRELLGAIEIGGAADQAEAGIVDDVLRLERPGGERRRRSAPRRRGCARSIGSTSGFGRPAGRDLRRPARSSRCSRRATSTSAWPLRGKHARQLRADAGRRAGDERDRRHAPPLPLAAATRWRKRDALVRRHAEQVGDAPDQIVLELARRRRRRRRSPTSSRPCAAARSRRASALSRLGEVIEIDRLAGRRRWPARSARSAAASSRSKRRFSSAVQLVALGVRDVAVDRRGVDQQRRRGDAIIVVVEIAGLLCRRWSDRRRSS